MEKREFLDGVEEEGRELVERIHQYNPKYIFLTETSSVQVGLLIKEALKTAFPNDPTPIFYRIDPKQVLPVIEYGQKKVNGEISSDPKMERKSHELGQFFKKRIKDPKERVLVYDRDWSEGKSPGSIVALLKNPSSFGLRGDIKCSNVKMNLGEGLGNDTPHSSESYRNKTYRNKDLGENEYSYYTSGRNTGRVILDIGKEDVVNIPGGYGGYPYADLKLTDKIHPGNDHREGAGNYNFRAKIRRRNKLEGEKSYKGWHSSQNELIQEIKQQGRMLGALIREEKGKRQDLEKKVISVIAIAGFLGSLVFLQSNITGNAIADLSTNTTSFLGIGLLAAGLVAGLLWLKNRK